MLEFNTDKPQGFRHAKKSRVDGGAGLPSFGSVTNLTVLENMKRLIN